MHVSMVPVLNVSAIDQQLARIWIPAHQTRDIPIHVALRYMQDKRFRINPADAQYTPSKQGNNLVGFNFVSPISLSDGYGQGGVFMAEAVLDQGVDVDVYPAGWLSQQGISPRLHHYLNKKMKTGYTVGVGRGNPSEVLARTPGTTIIANTMWESDRILDDWVTALNRCTAVVLPCKAQFPIFRDSGVKRPFHAVPEPLDTEYWSNRTAEPQPNIFKIVSWSRMSSRKMPMEMLQVFAYTFPADKYPHVRFELKTNNGQFGAGAMIPHIADKRIRITDGVWTLDQLREWVSSANAGFFLSRGEGMFVPPMQAMCLGVPIVVANHTGPSDYADERYNYPVDLDEKKPLVPSPQGDMMNWWNPSLEHASAQLLALYNNPKEAAKRAKAGQKMVISRYSKEVVAQKLIEVVKRYG